MSDRDAYGPYRINPAFDRFPEEALLVGKLLAGFGEIEFAICRNAGHAAGMPEAIGKALYRLRATSSRIDAADALARGKFGEAGLGAEYEISQRMVWVCLRIRNQFAHCNWTDHPETPATGLFFADLQASADATEGFEYTFRHVDVPLLRKHEAYFALTMEWLSYLDVELGVRQGKLQHPGWPKPPAQEPPPLHNSPEKHVPPWLTEDQKALHIGRALAAQGGAPTPTPAQQAQDRRREEKRAKRQADRERHAAKRSDSDSQP
jgi:hypothetical protein